MANARTFDLAIIAITFVGGYVLYRACVNFGWALSQLAVYPYYTTSDLLALFTTPVTMALFGGGAVLARRRLARGLFGSLEVRTTELETVPLHALTTAIGVFFLASGTLCAAEEISIWLAANVDPTLEQHPSDVWPARVTPVVELAIGYVLAFRTTPVVAWLLRQQNANTQASSPE